MAITTLDQVIAGARPLQLLSKANAITNDIGGQRGTSLFRVDGTPPEGANPAAATSGSGKALVYSDYPNGGPIPRSNPTGGQLAYLSRWSMQSNLPGLFILADRLFQRGGLSATSISLNSFSGVQIPARDMNGLNLGHGCMAAVELGADVGSGTGTTTIVYTDADGNTGQVATAPYQASASKATLEIFNTPNGVRSIQSIQQSVSRTSGGSSLSVIIFRPIASLPVLDNGAAAIDALTGGLPRIFDDSVLFPIWFPGSGGVTGYSAGSYQETWG